MTDHSSEPTTGGASRYDLVLGLVPGAYALALLAWSASAFSLPAVLVAASVVALTGIADVVAVHPPR